MIQYNMVVIYLLNNVYMFNKTVYKNVYHINLAMLYHLSSPLTYIPTTVI